MPVDVTTPSDREIRTARVVDAPMALVFECHTRPDLLKRWLLGPDGWTMPVCEVDLRVGGAYRYVWESAGQETMSMSGIYREIDPPARIVQTQLFNDDPASEALVTLELIERDGRTEVINVILYPSREVRDMMLRSGMADGMEAGYGRLEGLMNEIGGG